MMKIVINAKYGGFGLSMLGEREYLKRKGKKAYFYKQLKDEHQDGSNEYVLIDDITKKVRISYTFTKNMGKSLKKFPTKSKAWFYDRGIKRNDPDLVTVVKKLGKKANGDSALLEIVEVPDDAKWHIEEYAGNEHVAEDHRTWG